MNTDGHSEYGMKDKMNLSLTIRAESCDPA